MFETAGVPKELFQMRRKRDSLEDQLQRVQWKLGQTDVPESDKMEMESEVALLRKEYEVLRESHTNTLNQFQKDFHGVWGAIGKTGYINSRFANQIGRFACLYTSHVGNLSYYSPNKSYRALQDELPHDGIID